MKRNKKNHMIMVLIVFLLALAVGYAIFGATLTIKGTATGTTSWDVKFTSARILNAAKEEDKNHGTVVISQTATAGDTITAKIDLKYPGDGVILEAVVTNGGQMPALLKEFTIEGVEPGDVDLEVKQGTSALAANEVLKPGQTCTAQFAIKWKTTSTATTLGTKTFTIKYVYEQKTDEVNLEPTHSDSVV